MTRTAKILTALVVAAFAMPGFAQDKAPSKTEQTGNETRDVGTAKKKTPEQIAKETADKEKIRADATKPAKTAQEKSIERTGNETRDTGTYKKKTEEEKAKDKADAAKKRTGTTPEEQEKAKKVSPGS